MRKLTMDEAMPERRQDPSRNDGTSTIPAGAKFGGSIGLLNRWTGKPHENTREIARRARQAERRA